MKYKNRVRSRISNLKDPKNPGLRRNVLAGSIELSRIASMSAEVRRRLQSNLQELTVWLWLVYAGFDLFVSGNGQRRAETAEERSHAGGHPGTPDGQNWWDHHRPAAVRQVQEEELHLQPGKHLTAGSEESLICWEQWWQYKVCVFQVQTRSADEPMTTFVLCNECGNRWKVKSLSCSVNFSTFVKKLIYFLSVSKFQFCWGLGGEDTSLCCLSLLLFYNQDETSVWIVAAAGLNRKRCSYSFYLNYFDQWAYANNYRQIKTSCDPETMEN